MLAISLHEKLWAQEAEKIWLSPDSGSMLSPATFKDTIAPADIMIPQTHLNQATDSAKLESGGDIKMSIQYHAEDSMYFDIVKQIVHLYGNAHIDYGEVSLDAAYIQLDWINNTLTAQGMLDSTGQIAGKPVFKEGNYEYQTEHIKYNFKTRKAYIKGVLTKPKEAEGYVYGETVKKNEYDEVFIKKGWYTTCDCEPGEVPDYYIKSNKMKIVPGNLVVSGPFHMVIADVPTPLGLPFGIFPMPHRQNSGIIMPAYGEESQRGFFLKNGGYYFDINEYVNLTVLGEIYSKGSYGFQVISDYNKRYAYSGGLNFQFNRQRSNVDTEDPQESNDFRLSFQHTPFARGNNRFSASVNVASSSFIENNPSSDVNDNLRTTLSSSIMYATSFRNTPFNLSLSFRHNQNLLTNVFNVTLPDISFNMNRVYPFKNLAKSSSSWLSKLNLNYQMAGSNQISNDKISYSSQIATNKISNLDPLADSVLEINGENLTEILKRSEIGVKHSVPVSTSFNFLNHFTISPSFNYEEIWYFKKLNYTFLEDQNLVQIDTIPGFNRVYNWSTGASATTRLYGTYHLRGKRVQAIRHTLIPSIGFSYRPDFSDPKYGYYQVVQTDNGYIYDLYAPGNNRYNKVISVYDGFLYGAPSSGKSGAISFSLNNNLEMKVRNEQDTAKDAAPTRKISILESLSLSTSYNLMADSFKLAPFTMAARTSLFNKKVSISANMSMDPYSYEPDIYNLYDTLYDGSVYQNFVRTNHYAWLAGSEEKRFNLKLGTITSASISFNTNLNPKAREKNQEPSSSSPQTGFTEQEIANVNQQDRDFVDFDIPWNLSLRYSLSYTFDPRTRLLRAGTEESSGKTFTQSIMFNGDVNLSPKWKIGFQSGFDFDQQEITMTNINVFRDLGCFEMRFDWVPFGKYTSYYVQINVKSSLLKDLKLQRRRSWQDY